jgi:predicted secreted acid phosphatase
MKQLVQACSRAGICIFYVTARPDDPENRRYTERQLSSCGLDKHHTLYMMPSRSAYGKYKWNCRRHIESAGYTILLSIGDQFPDLTRDKMEHLKDDAFYIGCIGDNKTYAIKLPSEFL